MNRRALFRPGGFGALLEFVSREAKAGPRQQITVARRAMACEFSLVFPGESRHALDAGCAALAEVERLEAKLSVFRPGSDLSYLNRAAADGPVHADAEVYDLLRTAVRLAEATGGAFDAATGALVRAWGFLHGSRRVPDEAERRAALESSGSSLVEFDDTARTVQFRRPGVELNLGSIGKGYAIDRALARIRNVRCVLMQGGQSSLKAMGSPPGEDGWTVAIGDPLKPGRALAHVRLRDRALGTSGAANQFFVSGGRRWGHVLDPRTGWPANRLAGASAIAATATEADALSTAFFVLGLEGTRRYCRAHPGVGAVLVLHPKNHAAPEVVLAGTAKAEVIL